MTEKRLASIAELKLPEFKRFMEKLNRFAHQFGLQEYRTFSRIWEYPWIWNRLKSLKGNKLRVLDVGSEKSPFPWFLSEQGFDVTVSDLTAKYWKLWRKANRQIRKPVKICLLDTQNLSLPTSTYDIYLSVSVIEHIPEKEKTIKEAARVLRPGGFMIMTFDICESALGMTFPEWNGQALSMDEFDRLFKDSEWFEPGVSRLVWNTDDISKYLTWHRSTASHHNYVTGGAVVRRNERVRMEST